MEVSTGHKSESGWGCLSSKSYFEFRWGIFFKRSSPLLYVFAAETPKQIKKIIMKSKFYGLLLNLEIKLFLTQWILTQVIPSDRPKVTERTGYKCEN